MARISVRFPWRRVVATVEPGFAHVLRGYAAIIAHEAIELTLGSRVAHGNRWAARYALGVSGAPYELLEVPGMVASGERIGWHTVVTRDLVWTSDNSNLVAYASIAPADVGLVTLYGARLIADSGDQYGGDDAVGMLTVTTNSGDLILYGLTAGGVALDLDSTDVAAARVEFIGD